MNILTDKLPDTIYVSGSHYPVNTDFRSWISIELALTNSYDYIEGITKALTLCYKEHLPQNLETAVFNMLLFYNCNNTYEKNTDNNKEKIKKIYCFDYDSKYIYSAFMSQYNINLAAENLHWFLFKALFENLNENNQFVKIMQYRSVNLSDIRDKELKKFYRKMKHIYKLPDYRTEEQVDIDMMNELSLLF